jgi:hypothetical protein
MRGDTLIKGGLSPQSSLADGQDPASIFHEVLFSTISHWARRFPAGSLKQVI